MQSYRRSNWTAKLTANTRWEQQWATDYNQNAIKPPFLLCLHWCLIMMRTPVEFDMVSFWSGNRSKAAKRHTEKANNLGANSSKAKAVRWYTGGVIHRVYNMHIIRFANVNSNAPMILPRIPFRHLFHFSYLCISVSRRSCTKQRNHPSPQGIVWEVDEEMARRGEKSK